MRVAALRVPDYNAGQIIVREDYVMTEETGDKENEPTILNPDQVAVVYDEKDGYQILLPHYEDEAIMPEQAAVLVAAGMRLTDDEDFYKDLLNWMEQRQKELVEE